MVTPRNVGLLQELDIRWVVFHALPGYDIHAAIAMADSLPELRRVTEVGDSVVYELAPEDARAAAGIGDERSRFAARRQQAGCYLSSSRSTTRTITSRSCISTRCRR